MIEKKNKDIDIENIKKKLGNVNQKLTDQEEKKIKALKQLENIIYDLADLFR